MVSNSVLLYKVQQIQDLEEVAIKKLKISEYTLMQRAGKSAFAEIKKRFPKVKNITIVCGRGNNAGDGYVVATLAKKARFKVKVLQLAPLKELRGATKKAALECKKLKIEIKIFNAKELVGSKLIVDAILGTGLKGKVRSNFQKAIKVINKSEIPVFSLDLPSGLDADSGRVFGEAIKAQSTITFIGNKIGLLVGEARDYCGDIVCSDLDLFSSRHSRARGNPVFKIKPFAKKLDLAEEIKSLKPRKNNSHKGDFGHVLIIGGDLGMSGAPRMAAEAALRVGAGLVTVATRKEHAPFLNITRPEIMVHGISTAKQLKPLLDEATVIVIGPGLGASRWGKSLFKAVENSNRPLIVDADGLNILSAKKVKSRDNWILTPHPGEAGRLLKISTQEVQGDRLLAVKRLQGKFGGVAVLKGSGTIISAKNEKIRVCDAGNPGMASAGMGDILSGIIAGFVAQRLDLFDATKLGVLVHALAGDMVANKYGQLGMVALDLLAEVREVVDVSSLRAKRSNPENHAKY